MFWKTCGVLGERRLADPGRAFAAHLGEGRGVAVHQMRHVWQPMPASASEPSGTWVEVLCGQPEQKYGRRARSRAARCAALLARRASASRRASVAHARRARSHARDDRRRDLERRSSSPSAGSSDWPRSSSLPTTRGRRVGGQIVQSCSLICVSISGALLLDHQDLVAGPAAKCEHALRLERPGHATLKSARPRRCASASSMPEIVERLAHVEIGLAAGDDAEARHRAVPSSCRSRRLARAIGERRGMLDREHPPLLRRAMRSGQRMCSAVRRQHEVGRASELARGADRHRPMAGDIDRLGQHLEARPTGPNSATGRSHAGRSRDTPARRRMEHRHAGRDEAPARSGGQGRGLRRCGRRRPPPARRRACEVPA